MKKALIGAVTSIRDLAYRAHSDPKYEQLAKISASNLGGDGKELRESIQWLIINAAESGSEQSVVDEINFCRNLVQ